MVAMRAALVSPDRVDALLLLDTDAGAERPFNRIKYRVMAGAGHRSALEQPREVTDAMLSFLDALD